MEPSIDDNRMGEGRGGTSEAGCLTWAPYAIGAGVLLSFFSIVYSVRFIGYDLLGFCPNGFVAGFPLAFVEFYDGDAGVDANNPPSTLFGMLALGGQVSKVCPLGVVLNIFVWVAFAILTATLIRWFSRLPP
jgi:hypothetical protein